MKNITVQSLRKSGYKIRVTHYRWIMQNIDENHEALFPKRKYDKLGKLVNPKGGETQIDVTTPDNRDFSQTVKCHIKDSYNKKIGVQIALGRIFKIIENENTTI